MTGRPRPIPPLGAAAAKRQSEVTRLAMLLMGHEAAIRFMNSHHATLGGRPIDLAIASEEGRVLVEGALGKNNFRDGKPAAE